MFSTHQVLLDTHHGREPACTDQGVWVRCVVMWTSGSALATLIVLRERLRCSGRRVKVVGVDGGRSTV